MRILFDACVVKTHLTGMEVYAIELPRRLAGREGLARAAMFSWERTADETWAAYERAVAAIRTPAASRAMTGMS